MPVSLAQVQCKAKAYVDALCKLPRSQYGEVPSGHFGRDYNTLRKLALEVLPEVDERLLGKYVTVRLAFENCEICEARFVEIETYARQIVEQLAAALGQPMAASCDPAARPAPSAAPRKAYDIEAIRQEYNQAYAPWSAQDDDYLRSRFLEGATIDDLAHEFGRQPGGIRARLRKLGLDLPGGVREPDHTASVPSLASQIGTASPGWRDQRPRAGRVWTPDEDAALVRDLDAGLPLEDIAKSLCRGVFSVEVRLAKLGRGSGKQTQN